MKKILFSFSTILLTSFSGNTQTLLPAIAQGVYGGTVKDIVNWKVGSDSIYIAVSTESSNSIFISKAARGSSRHDLPWKPLPSADIDNAFGSSIQNIEVHTSSNTLYFQAQDKLYSTSLTATTPTLITNLVKQFKIIGDSIFIIKNGATPSANDTLIFGSISSGITQGLGLGLKLNPNTQFELNAATNQLVLYSGGSTPTLSIFNDPYYAFNSSTSLNSIATAAPTVPNIEWKTIGFAPDGTWYVAGQPPANNPTATDRWIGWSANNGLTWSNAQMDTPGPSGGQVGPNMIIDDYTGKRVIFCGNALLTDTSNMTNWNNVGFKYVQNLNRANDGYSQSDAIDHDLKYHTTNIGFGYSTNKGDSIFGWNDGLEAVQVNDIDMSRNFSVGWIASKSGVRKVSDYKTSTPIWANPIFPMGDGSPYESVGMDPSDSLTVFVANQRIYRTQNGGTPIGPSDGWSRVFSPENAPYNFNPINSICNAVKVSPDSAEIVLAGFSQKFNDRGGVFYSLDGGSTWNQLLIDAATQGQDVDVNDIELVKENDSIIAYIGVDYDIPNGIYGLYRAALGNSGTWSIRHDGSYGAAESILDINTTKEHDTLVLLSKNTGILPVHEVQIKALGTGAYTNFSGPADNGNASAITLGDNTLFMALNEKIYTNPLSTPASWSLGYSYPVGTEINVLFYDELLVGTGTGLYAHELSPSTLEINNLTTSDLLLFPNPCAGSFTIRTDFGIESIEIYSLEGKLVYQEACQGKDEITVRTNLNEGIYILDAEGHQQKFMKRFIIRE